jgi:ABC-type transport system involved in cytochrome c biogenesis permease subunit
MLRKLRQLAFFFPAITVMALAAISVAIAFGGDSALYSSWWMIVLWCIDIVAAGAYIALSKGWRRLSVVAIHASFVVILIGALTTYMTGESGTLTLRDGEKSSVFVSDSGSKKKFPFTVEYRGFEVINYPGTSTPADYVTHVVVSDNSENTEAEVAINRIAVYKGYRFYQGTYDSDRGGVTLLVTKDVAGICVTYVGYILLLIGIIIYFMERNSMFRVAIRRLAVASLLLLSVSTVSAKPKTISKELVGKMSELPVYFDSRVAPMSTMASDFWTTVHGSESYGKYSADEVVDGMIFFFSTWKDEPLIKVSNTELRSMLGIKGGYASYDDFFRAVTSGTLDVEHPSNAKMRKDIERFEAINSLVTGALLKFYPYKNESGEVEWYSPADNMPDDMPTDQWLFARKSLGYMNELVQTGNYADAVALAGKICEYQRKIVPEAISDTRLATERVYNRISYPLLLCLLCIIGGLVGLIMFGMGRLNVVLTYVVACIAFLWLTTGIVLQWIVMCNVPLSDGPMTMRFMAWCALAVGLIFAHKLKIISPMSLLVAGLSLAVAAMGGKGSLSPVMPVLRSPLLSIHVMLVMVSYALLTFMFIGGVLSLCVKADERERFTNLNRVALYPAVLLLAAGIFVGAVWANISWGRYWSWDPKEVWALITMMVYMPLLHPSLRRLQRAPLFNVYCIVAFVSVLITYFGVNYLLGGMHSYA